MTPKDIKQAKLREEQQYLDKCAIAAMQGMWSNDTNMQLVKRVCNAEVDKVFRRIAYCAELQAQAMLAERKKRYE